MADETTKPKTSKLLWLGAAGVGAYLLLAGKGKTAQAADSWLNTPLTDTSTGAASAPTPSPTTSTSGMVSSVGAAVASALAPVPAPVPVADRPGYIYSDGAPHRHDGTDQPLTSWNDTDRGNIQTIVNYWNSNGGRISIEDAVDIISYQERQERKKGWNDVARDYANNPSWFRDKVREWNNEGRTPRINIPT